MVAVSGEAVFDRIDETRQLVSELEPILQSLMLNDSTIMDGLAQMLGTLQQMHNRTEEHIANLAADIREMNTQRFGGGVPGTAARAATAAASDLRDPEIGLLGYLLPFLRNQIVLDVGANVGKMAAALIEAGYEVFAFEPFAHSYAELERKQAGAAGRLHVFPYAVGADDGEAQLLVAGDLSGTGKWDTSLFHSTVRHPMLDDLSFCETRTVKMATLATLARNGVIPDDAAVLKIDTEGADLDVIKGAPDGRFAVVLMEFWDRAHPFGRAGHGDLAGLVQEMRRRGYAWHIVLYRVDETGELGFFYNARMTVAKSWGNVMFFRDFAVFAMAAGWCNSALPDTNRSGHTV